VSVLLSGVSHHSAPVSVLKQLSLNESDQIKIVDRVLIALRQRAADVVEAELLRLDNRLPGLQSAQREEVARTVRRVVDKLLHAPTVRIKQLASAPGGDNYAEALRELFELESTAVDAVAAGELPVAPSESQFRV